MAKERLLSPMLVIDALGTGTANITLRYVRNYIITQLQQEENSISKHTDHTNQYKNDTEELRKKIENLRTGGVTFQGSRCSACHHQLELPSVHFLCQHSYHQHCFQSFSDNDECPACQQTNKSILDQLKAREHSKDLHETFHSLLERAPDGFTLAAEYFGRSVFNKVTIVTEPATAPTATPIKSEPIKRQETDYSSYRITEGRLRQAEGKTSMPPIVSISEGRMRLQERQYNASLEANLSKPSPKSSPKESPRRMSDTLSGNVVNKAAKDYDESKNPFNDGNTFEDDYDKNLNPFEM